MGDEEQNEEDQQHELDADEEQPFEDDEEGASANEDGPYNQSQQLHQQQQPLLFVDINLGGDEQERIVVYEGDTAVQLAHNFCTEHNLDEETQEKL